MHSDDFKKYAIHNVTEHDVKATNAPLHSVDLHLLLMLDRFINLVHEHQPDVRILILPNGLTTGSHMSQLHPRGLAVDVVFDGEGVDIYKVWKAAIVAGFTGIGVLFNQAYRMHLDLRPKLSIWGGYRDGEGNWHGISTFRDPREISEGAATVVPDVRPVQNAAQGAGGVSEPVPTGGLRRNRRNNAPHGSRPVRNHIGPHRLHTVVG